MHDVEPGVRPAAFALIGVHLGAPRVGVVEIAPRQHVDASDPRRAETLGGLLQPVERVAAMLAVWHWGHRSDDTPWVPSAVATMRTLVRPSHRLPHRRRDVPTVPLDDLYRDIPAAIQLTAPDGPNTGFI